MQQHTIIDSGTITVSGRTVSVRMPAGRKGKGSDPRRLTWTHTAAGGAVAEVRGATRC